ncbi:type II toxin-antitoxin system Phd/YefM family antitoxin [Candidatus Woesebacteria bacterium]|nr:type II toxin-antitoxin system Phd/YefM family antitoxin [Candidatus Woesebacteria bacterium]
MTHLMSISDVRSNLPDLVGKVNATLSRVTITVNGQPKAVILSAEELESLEETAEILTIPGIRESVKQGLKEAKKGRGVALSSL